jgi:hypothetical protein
MTKPHRARPLLPTLMLILLVVLPAVETLGATDLSISPPMQRLDLAADAVAIAGFRIAGKPGTVITAIMANCACIHSLTALPTSLDAGGHADISMRVTGMRPGVEDILVATSTGILRAQVQIVGPGAGRGVDQLRTALADAATSGCRILAIAHDLIGHVRHCGCSQGALGGAGRLARLPPLAAEMQPGIPVTWVLTGNVDGKQVGLGHVFAERGWKLGDATVRTSADPLPLLTAPGVVAVIPTTPVAVEHRRMIRPVLTDGMAVELLLVDAAGIIQSRRTMPVDDSLPDDATVALRFRDVLTSTIKAGENPSQSCIACHATAYAAWQQSQHARALESLKPEDRTDGCISCHTTPVAQAVLAPAVNCQSCHTGSAAHVASHGIVKTTGATDCRSCHDARHHPGFQREAAWKVIMHGRESVAPTP